MKRQWITAGVIGVCLVILGAIWFILGNPEETGEEDQKAETSVWKGKERIQEIRVENEQGGYILRWENDEAGAEGMEDLPFETKMADGIRDDMENMKTEKKVTDGKERLSDFGLITPKAQAEVIGENGKKIEISVGDEVPDQEDPSRYILWMDQVWTVKSSKVDGLLSGENGLISKKLTPDDTDGENSILVTRMTISRESEDDLTLAYAKSQELAGYTVNSYELVSPFTYPADAEVTSDVFPVLFGVEAKTVEAVHPSEEEKEKMGLSSPWRTLQVEYTDGADQTRSFTLAASRPENGQVYVMAGDTDVIYLCSQEDLPWLEYTEETLLSRTVLAPDIKTIEELVITEGGKTHRFRFEHVGEETEQITCDGTKTDGDSFRNFYYTLAGMSADEVLFDGFPDTSSMKEFLGIRYRYQDGTEDVLVCYEEGSRQIYGELNQKERGFRLSASQVETMLETLKRLTEGEEITARY